MNLSISIPETIEQPMFKTPQFSTLHVYILYLQGRWISTMYLPANISIQLTELMKKTFRIISCILAFTIGWGLDALAWSGYLKEPFASVALVLGVGLMLTAIVYPIIIIITNKNKDGIISFDEPRTAREWLNDFKWKLVNPTEKDINDLDRMLSNDEFWKWSSGKVEPIRRNRQ